MVYGDSFQVVSSTPSFQLLAADNSIKNIYSTLSAAVEDAQTGDSIVMGGNSEESISVTTPLTITRNGFTAANLSAGEGYTLITADDK